MKILFLMVMMSPTFAWSATAEEMPDYLRGGKVQVITRDGVVHGPHASEKYFMASREKSRKINAKRNAYINRLLRRIEKLEGRLASQPKHYKHTASAYVGNGPSGLEIFSEEGGVTVSPEEDLVVGATYHYLIYEEISVSGGLVMPVFNPRHMTYLIGVGQSW